MSQALVTVKGMSPSAVCAPSSRAIVRAIDVEVKTASLAELLAYLDGASRDGTFNARHGTWRISQRDVEWLRVLQVIAHRCGARSWIYREGKREVHVVETCLALRGADITSSPKRAAAFVRGYFDAEGGVPQKPGSRFYIQMVQKDKHDLDVVRERLMSLGVVCGVLHNPSISVDPDYWRFFVSSSSISRFASTIGSWHPRKRKILEDRSRRKAQPKARG